MTAADAGAVEAELEELQRRYRIMEGDRKAYADEVQNVLRKQRLHIEKLGKENAQLKQELSLETRAVATGGSAVRLSSQINKLTEAGDGYARRIELERQRTIQLDKQLKTMQDDLLKARVAMGGIHAPAESDYAVEKTVRILENRLDKALVKFNEAIAVNKELRNTIDNLRRERLSFDALYKKLQRELAEKKRSMAEIIEQANVAYEERDRLQAEAAKTRAASDAEAVAFEKEWKELGDVLDQDLKAHEAMSRELAKRAEAVAVAEGDARGSLTIAEEQALRRQSRAQAWGLAKDRTVVQTAAERAAAFEAAFAQIEARTGVTDISELVDRFVAAEEENFARFNQLNELLVEVEKAEEAVAEARAEVERARGNERGADSQRRRHAAELEAKVKAAEAKAEGYNQKWAKASELIGELGKAVEGACVRIGCNLAFLKEVGGESGVSESNMMVYLGVIEQRTNELLRLYAQLAGRGGRRAGGDSLQIVAADNDDNRTFLTSGAPLSARGSAPALPTDLPSVLGSVAVPTTRTDDAAAEEEEDDDDGRPLTREELKARTVRGLARRAEDAALPTVSNRPVSSSRSKRASTTSAF